MNNTFGKYLFIFAGALIIALIVRDGMIQSSASKPDATVQTVVQGRGEMTPFEIESPGHLAAALKKRPDGHYWAKAKVDNAHMLDFMVDTGASICVLTPTDAKRLGYDFNKLEKDLKIRTASGTIYGASIVIKRLEIGRVLLKDIDAVILDDNLEQSLLGMSFLERLSRWEVSKAAIIIHQ